MVGGGGERAEKHFGPHCVGKFIVLPLMQEPIYEICLFRNDWKGKLKYWRGEREGGEEGEEGRREEEGQ